MSTTIRIQPDKIEKRELEMFLINGVPVAICYETSANTAIDLIHEFLEDVTADRFDRPTLALRSLFDFAENKITKEELEQINKTLLGDQTWYILANDIDVPQAVDTTVFVLINGDKEAKEAVVNFLAYFGLM